MADISPSWRVTAYAAAVAGGYDQSYEQFCLDMAKMSKIDEIVDDVHGYAMDSEAFAKGTRDGSPVDSSDPAYHANSFWYSTIAGNNKTDAQNARDDAVSARNSAQQYKLDAEAWANGTRNASPITSGDEAYEKNSKYWASESADSATEAKGYRDGCQEIYDNMQFATDEEVEEIITEYDVGG